MALDPTTILEVRNAGNDTNGGGFVPGSSGTDWSQQNAAQYSVADGVTNGTTTITSATATFGTDVVGNLIYVVGGTGSITAGWYQIISRTNATTIVVDRSAGLTAGTGVTLNIGGAFATLGAAAGVATTGFKVWVKKGSTYGITASVTFTGGGLPNAAQTLRVWGYNAVRGDNGQPTIQITSGSGISALAASGSAVEFRNFIVDCNNQTNSVGIDFSGGVYGYVQNCKVSNFTASTAGILGRNDTGVTFCEVTGGSSAVSVAVSGGFVFRCNVHDNACPGISAITAVLNRVVNNTGASSDGILVGQTVALFNTVYGNGRHGIAHVNSYSIETAVRGNILAKNGGYGQVTLFGSFAAKQELDGNAYWSNTSGTRHNIDDTSGNNASGTYTNPLDVIISGTSPTNDPFTNAGAGDFTLNNIAGAGALLRGTCSFGGMPGDAHTTFADFGCYQHQDNASGGQQSFVF